MIELTNEDLEIMQHWYDHEVAKCLVARALQGSTIGYKELSQKFNRANQSWGKPLDAIAIRCARAGLPILSVLVVKADTRRPSEGADLYARLGIGSPDNQLEEQQRCFDYDWVTPLLRGEP